MTERLRLLPSHPVMKPKLVILAVLAVFIRADALAGGQGPTWSEAAPTPPVDASAPDFTQLLDEAGMAFVLPNGWCLCGVVWACAWILAM